jgi:hypothetical protein
MLRQGPRQVTQFVRARAWFLMAASLISVLRNAALQRDRKWSVPFL